ncbi:hypothetical protein [Flavobacterium rhizosphaerae]|uniref:Lipocalin-like domain-containing protein n=1 Tax=Flavobacterium rhizosphaerae TaxID=3163298 RepID=A0ABW8YW38_9FLAO
MKKIFSLLILSFLFMGCNNDDTKKQEYGNHPSMLVGQWKLVGWYSDEPLDINNDGEASTNLYSQWNGCNKNNILVLNADGTSQMMVLGNPENSDCIIFHDNYEYLPWYTENINDPAFFTLTFMGDDYNITNQIVQMSGTLLTLKDSGFLTCCDPGISNFTGGYLKFEKVLQE